LSTSLFERLGKSEGIRNLVDDIVKRHLANPVINKRFEPLVADPERMAVVTQHLCDFLETGSGGPTPYTGKSMVEAHRGMNISGEEYLAAVDDIMGALHDQGVDQDTQKDVLFITYSLKPEIARL
jgi:hemoglobin